MRSASLTAPEFGDLALRRRSAFVGRAVGLSGAAFTLCVSDGRYLDWPAYVTAGATALGVDATPTVLAQGAAVRPDVRAITAAVAAAHGGQ